MQQPHIFTVFGLNSEVRQVIEQGFGSIWLVGEISNFTAASSGHWYFTLKDERAQIRAAMFRQANQRSQLQPQHGMQVLVRAKVTVYEPRGDYQLIVEHMEDAGLGLLQQRYEQLKAKLQAAGLFAPDHKQPLPTTIRKVGVITSPTGAAVRDILAVFKRRDPSIEVIIYPSSVQGKAAVTELLQMLQRAVTRNEVDVLILARGGGSLEDLWCFNDEQLAHAIYQCSIPTISAVGHETDFTISDFVADVRAPTPSAAAELVSRDHRDQVHQLQQLEHRAQRAWQRRYEQQQQAQRYWTQRLQQQHPKRQIERNQQRSDELLQRSQHEIGRIIKQTQLHQQQLQTRLTSVHPERQLKLTNQQLEQLQQRLYRATTHTLKQSQQQFQHLMQNLQLVSPLQTIARGYAVVQKLDGQVVRNPDQLQSHEKFRVRVADGEFTALKTE